MIVTKGAFRSLYVPILIEQLFILLMGQADTLMLNSYSTNAVAASGMTSQILMLITFLITIIHVGTNIRIVHLKAHQTSMIPKEIYHNLLFNIIVSIVFTLVVGMVFSPLLHLFQVPKDIFNLTYQFGLVILSVLTLTSTQMYIGTVLRVMNYAAIATRITVISNLTNIILNAFVLFIIPDLVGNPVLAIAYATAISHLLGCLLAFIALLKIYRPKLHYFKINFKILYQVSTLGIPSAGEQISYNFAQTFTTAFIAMLGTQVIAAKSVATVLSGLSFSCAMAFSAACQIYLGHFIARHRYSVLKKTVLRSIWFNVIQSLIIMVCVLVGFVAVGRWLTHDVQTYHLIIYYLVILIGLEPIRAINNLIVDLLNVAGDVRFPVTVNIITTWLLLLPGSFLLGIHLGFGYTGIILVSIADEALRFIIMYFRWRNDKWRARMKQIGV